MSKVKDEDTVKYNGVSPLSNSDLLLITNAQQVIKKHFTTGPALTSPKQTIDFLQVLLGAYEHEVFACLMMDNRNRVIVFREMFCGTIDGASVYPREIVKQALADNAAAVILAHNHPSGVSEPSQADIRITERLKKALALVDIRVLDHVIIGDEITCLSEQGLL